MSTAHAFDQPSMTARLRYSLRKVQAPFRAELEGLSLSSTSSRDSMSLRTTSTAATDVSQDDDCDQFEDLRVLSSAADVQRSWSSREVEFRRDLADALRGEPSLSGHKYMLRLRFAGKSGESWRPCVLLLTQSAKTKLTLASYFLTGPPILRRLVGCGLDIHIVHSSFGLSSSDEDVEHGTGEHTGQQAWVDPDMPINGARLVVEHATAGHTSIAVGGGVLLVGGKSILVTTQHPFELDDDANKACFDREASSLASEPAHVVEGAISVYHEDVEDDIIRLDCADVALDNFKSFIDGGRTMTPSSGHAIPLSKYHKPLKCILAMMKDKVTQAKGKQEHKVKRSIPQKAMTSSSSRPHGHKSTNRSGLVPARVVYTGANLDWSALELLPKHDTAASLLPQLNHIGGHVIDSVLDTKVCNPINVTLGTSDGDISGRLLPDEVLYHVGGRDLELQVVRLDKPLQRGTSGSWVTHCNQFCGMVLAISDDLPEAFILPGTVLINDIERVCGAKVLLPTSLDQLDLSSHLPSTESNITLHGDNDVYSETGTTLLESNSQIRLPYCDPYHESMLDMHEEKISDSIYRFPASSTSGSRSVQQKWTRNRDGRETLPSPAPEGDGLFLNSWACNDSFPEDNYLFNLWACCGLAAESDGLWDNLLHSMDARRRRDSAVSTRNSQWAPDNPKTHGRRDPADDFLICVLGETGVGKSTFVKSVVDWSEKAVPAQLIPNKWLEREQCSYWIQGKPGSGKSVLSKHVLGMSRSNLSPSVTPLATALQLLCQDKGKPISSYSWHRLWKEQIISEIRQQLANRDNSRWVLGFDNVDDGLQISSPREAVALSRFVQTRSFEPKGSHMLRILEQMSGLAGALSYIVSARSSRLGSSAEDTSRDMWYFDLKPRNIIVYDMSPTQCLFKIADFGVSTFKQYGALESYQKLCFEKESTALMDNNLGSLDICGTFDYAHSHKKAVWKDRSSDVFALGAVYTELLTWMMGRTVSTEGQIMENPTHCKYMIHGIRNRVKGLAEIEHLIDLIESMTHSDPHQRPSLKEVADRIFEKSIPEVRKRLEEDENFYVKWFAKISLLQARETIQAELMDQTPSKLRWLKSRARKLCQALMNSTTSQRHAHVFGNVSRNRHHGTQPKPNPPPDPKPDPKPDPPDANGRQL